MLVSGESKLTAFQSLASIEADHDSFHKQVPILHLHRSKFVSHVDEHPFHDLRKCNIFDRLGFRAILHYTEIDRPIRRLSHDSSTYAQPCMRKSSD